MTTKVLGDVGVLIASSETRIGEDELLHGADRPFVTVVMPALNEERYIARALLSLSQISDAIDYEILVLDGGSTDYTARIIEGFSAGNPRFRLIANERRIQSAAVNKAAAMADPRARYMIRADCHADYPPGFIESCVGALERTGAASVVVQMRTVGVTCFQKAVAAAQNSRLGNGGAAHRSGGVSRFVDHGHHAAFRRDTFLAIGGYDESFTHNEDAEFDVRLRRSGNRIWLNADAVLTYFPRSSIAALAIQYYRHGRGRASTILKHRMVPKVRQLLPLAAVGLGLLGLVLGAIDPLFLLVPTAYVSAALLAGAVLAVRSGSPCTVASGLAALVMHTGWAVGFATRFTQAARRRPEPARRPSGVDLPSPVIRGNAGLGP